MSIGIDSDGDPGTSRDIGERILFAGPVLHQVVSSVRIPQSFLTCRSFPVRQIENDPLRMEGIIFTGEFAGEIRIALPICARIAVRDARVLARERPSPLRVSSMRHG